MPAMKAQPIEQDVVVVRMRIAAEPATVWSFMSDAARFTSWIGSMGGGPPQPGTCIEPRVGGALRVVYSPTSAARGEITAIEAPRRIEFTWGYEDGANDMPVGSSRVELILSAIDGGTLVELRHRGIPNDAARKGHFGGWTHYLSMLSRNAVEAQHAEKLAARVDAYFAAWREADATKRTQLLEECCEPNVAVRTNFACTDDIASLSAHIENSLRHMPGMTLAGDGAPQHLQGHARAAWKVTAPNGAVVFRGSNFYSLSLKSRFTLVVGFADAG